jgi:uncharacterized protein
MGGLPIDVHVFPYKDGTFYAFDVRNYAILRLDAPAAAVLARMRDFPLEAITADLSDRWPAETVRGHYLQFLELIRDGALSVMPVDRPGRPLFNHLVIMLAGGCNMGCTYCFEKDVPVYQHLNLMTREHADEIVDWFMASQEGEWAHVQLYGGEALLNWPILQHVVERLETWADAESKRLTKYLITNGTLLNAERIAYLNAHAVEIQVSVDGDHATHDKFRVLKSGAPTLDRIKRNIDELNRQKANFNLRAVLTRANLDPGAVIEGLKSHGSDDVSFEVVATDYAPARLSDGDWHAFNDYYRKHVDRTFERWADVPHEMQSTISSILNQRHTFYGCGAGLSEVTVDPNGNIYECQRIYRQPFAHVSDGRRPEQFNSTLLTMVDDRPVCQDCWARYLCGGGCMHQAHTEHGADAPVEHYCVMKRTLVESSITAIARMRSGEMPVADAPERLQAR